MKSACAAVESGDHAVLHVKTAHGRFPKKFLETEMKDMPGGCWVVMTGRATKEGVDLVAVGYKYNKKKVLCFVLTRGAGSTKAGVPYKAKFNDAFGNVVSRDVPRPKVLNLYFDNSNCVDMHNQSRQHFLALEECWVTTDGYFRQWTTFTGITITDLWRLKLREQECKDDDNKRIVEFADEVVWSLLQKAKLISSPSLPSSCVLVSTQSDVSKISSPSASLVGVAQHTKYFLSKKGRSKDNSVAAARCRFKGTQARCIWCSRVKGIKNVKTKLVCLECGYGYCDDSLGRDCWTAHVAHGGNPELVRETMKKRRFDR